MKILSFTKEDNSAAASRHNTLLACTRALQHAYGLKYYTRHERATVLSYNKHSIHYISLKSIGASHAGHPRSREVAAEYSCHDKIHAR